MAVILFYEFASNLSSQFTFMLFVELVEYKWNICYLFSGIQGDHIGDVKFNSGKNQLNYNLIAEHLENNLIYLKYHNFDRTLKLLHFTLEIFFSEAIILIQPSFHLVTFSKKFIFLKYSQVLFFFQDIFFFCKTQNKMFVVLKDI